MPNSRKGTGTGTKTRTETLTAETKTRTETGQGNGNKNGKRRRSIAPCDHEAESCGMCHVLLPCTARRAACRNPWATDPLGAHSAPGVNNNQSPQPGGLRVELFDMKLEDSGSRWWEGHIELPFTVSAFFVLRSADDAAHNAPIPQHQHQHQHQRRHQNQYQHQRTSYSSLKLRTLMRCAPCVIIVIRINITITVTQ